MRNTLITLGLASALVLAACGKKEEAAPAAAEPAAAPAMEAPAAEAPAEAAPAEAPAEAPAQ